jgi:hypothetical protein
MDDLDLDALESILAEPEPVRRKRVSKAKTDDRSITGWFSILHTAQRNCEVPSHDEKERPRSKGMTTIINDVAVCRICFLNKKDLQ